MLPQWPGRYPWWYGHTADPAAPALHQDEQRTIAQESPAESTITTGIANELNKRIPCCQRSVEIEGVDFLHFVYRLLRGRNSINDLLHSPGKGDGHKWAVELGGEVFGTGMMGLQGFNLNIGYYGEVGTLSGNPDLIVNLDTERFEFASLFYGYKLKQLLDQPDSQAVGIYGTTEERQEALEKGVTMGWIKKFDTMEDLAAEFKLDTEKLESAAAEAELAGAPYYAATIRPLFIGSIPGLRVDANCRVLANGEPIENLYAAGELIFSNVFQDHYPASGSGMGTSTYTGAIAADTAIGDM